MIPRTDTFIPAEWDEFFAQFDSQMLSQRAAGLCTHLVRETGLSGDTIQQAIDLIAKGVIDDGVLADVESLVSQCEERNDALTEVKPGQLPFDHPEVTVAFRQMVAMHALRSALEQRFSSFAYEAIHTLNDEQSVLRYFLD
ncbi:MAG: hypothetical protein KDA93_04015 [Planctomycetaceae bacterium]|nr:hypothetical protein [Planctomycetaceae bacterium]